MPHHAGRTIAELGFGQAHVQTPRLATQGVRVTGVAALGDGLVFRAEGGVAPGIYAENPGESARLILPDSPSEFHMAPQVAGPLLAVFKASLGRIPPVMEEVLFTFQGAVVLRVPGQSLGVSGDGRSALVVDLLGQRLQLVDLQARQAAEIGHLEGRMHPSVAPLVALNRDGTQALYMDAREVTCDGSLELIHLRSGESTTVVEALPAPARLCGALGPHAGGMVVVQMAMAGGPHFKLMATLEDGTVRTVLEHHLAQPLAVPVFLNEHIIALPLTLKAAPGSLHSGPVDLYAVDLRNGETQQLTTSGQANGRVRAVDGAVLVEGGGALVRVPFLRPQ